MDFYDPRSQALLTLASGLLSQSGWQPRRVTFGEALGKAGIPALQAAQQARQNQVSMEDLQQMRLLRALQMKKLGLEVNQEEALPGQLNQWARLVSDADAMGGGSQQQPAALPPFQPPPAPTPMAPYDPNQAMRQNLLGPFAGDVSRGTAPAPIGMPEDVQLAQTGAASLPDIDTLGSQAKGLYDFADKLELDFARRFPNPHPNLAKAAQTQIASIRSRAERMDKAYESASKAPETRELEIGMINGQPHIQPQEWDRKSRSWKNVGKPTPKFSAQSMVDVKINTGESFWKEFGKGQAEFLNKQQEKAQQAADAINVIHNMRRNVDKGMFTGITANVGLNFGRALSAAGFEAAKDPVANTQAFAAEAGNLVAQIIKEFGSGTGLSDADREYATKIAAGDISLDEKAIKRLLDIREKANRILINRYNRRIGQVKKKAGSEGIPFSMEVDEPPAYKGGDSATIRRYNPATGKIE